MPGTRVPIVIGDSCPKTAFSGCAAKPSIPRYSLHKNTSRASLQRPDLHETVDGITRAVPGLPPFRTSPAPTGRAQDTQWHSKVAGTADRAQAPSGIRGGGSQETAPD